jgi:2,4-dienoyl-CoA reductase-like NADH-dependent reductase (Old Yellow Enzyme family)
MVELFEPYKIGNLELKNRFVRSATWDATADSSGAVTDASLAVFRKLAKGGVGLIITAFAYVSPLGQAMERQYGVHTDSMIQGLNRLVEATHKEGAKIALQIVHAGINSMYLPLKGIIPIAVSHRPDIDKPHREMTSEEIEATISDFVAAAVRAREAGFDAVQLHGAHGYLMSQFLSPLSNLRTDKWGGNADNRRRFHLEIVRRTRQAIGDGFPLLIKLGVQEDTEGGLSLAESVETAQQIENNGINAIEVSTGDGIPKVAPVAKKGDPERAFFRERAAAVKRVVAVPVMLVGGIRSLEMAQNIVDSGDADLISIARPFIREPDLIARWQKGDHSPATCISCHRCHPVDDEPVQCAQETRARKSIIAD